MPGIGQRGVLCSSVGLAAPLNVREGDVTDTSIQVSWDRADGDFEQYEVTCTNCASAFKVCCVEHHLCIYTAAIFQSSIK